ncbi:NLR family CARD domain-containing protein 3-like isoform X2 [Acropora millepora]|nr:NLR family CARD domain-containing protein 3-like isoform X2 [Acropora millepora]XP_044170664.1 NLR family CARD domain-containing protein 3-like isoform X2 [Acropora millepora]
MKRRITEENEHEQPAGTSSEPETTAQEVEARKHKRIKNFTGLDESVSFKPGTPSEDDFLIIAHELGPLWKMFDRVLKVPDAVIDQIEADESKVSEKCYTVLTSWQERYPKDATYHRLALALKHPAIGRVDLAEKYCGLQLGTSAEPEITVQAMEAREQKGNKDFTACPSWPSHVIERIREVCKKREGVILPVPWCEGFSFQIEDIFTRLRIVAKEKTRGTLTSKEVTSMTSIFTSHDGCEQPLIVLIEGEPGMGKTTYCRKLVYDWARKQCHQWDKSFPIIDVLLFLRCREIKSTIWDAIEDQILPKGIEPEERKMFFQFLKENPSKVLLVLDGLDEADPQKQEMFLKLIQREELPGCYIVLTSRHEAGDKVRPYTDTLLEIVGFTTADAVNYIRKYFQQVKVDMAEELTESIFSNVELMALTQNPLNTLLLCVIFEDLEGVLPSNRTHLYEEIVRFILRRYESKTDGLSNRGKDLLLVYKKELMILGRTALDCLRKGELYFDDHKGDIKESLLMKFGFLTIQSGGSKRAPCDRYGFFHKSFQEFFSGYFLAFSIIDDVTTFHSVLTDPRYMGELFQVFKFMSGIIAQQSEQTALSVVESIASILNERGLTSDKHDSYLEVAHYFINECKTFSRDLHTKLTCSFGESLKLVDVVVRLFQRSDEYIGTFLQALTCNTTVTNLKLFYMRLSKEYIDLLAHALSGNTPFSSLDLRSSYGTGRTLADDGAKSLPQALRVNTSLSSLDLRGNSIGDKGANSLAQALIVNTSLSSLGLYSNSIGDKGANSLAQALRVNTSLSSLGLYSNSIGDEGANSLAQVLRVNTSLSSLDLQGNSIGHEGANSLAQALRVNTSLSSLYLSRNPISDEGANSLAQALRVNTSISSLDLGGNSIGDAEANLLAQALRGKISFSLYWSRNSIGHEGANSLAQALRVNTSLSSLDLGGNSIDDEGANSLAQALRVNTSLSSLVLGTNLIGDEGANSLAQALRVNTSLSSLDLGYNYIGDEGANSLAQALRVNTCLSSLGLYCNSIGHGGANSLAQALRVNTSLSSLDLGCNSIGDEGANSLAQALRVNTSLSSLDLDNNSIGDEGANSLAQTLRVNNSLSLVLERPILI